MLLAKSTDGGQTFSAPVKVGDYYDLPDCDTYQGAGADPGRACVPEKGPTSHSIFRATNYPSGAVNPKNPSQVAVTYGSYINSSSKESNGCAPAGFSPTGLNMFTGVKTAGACNNKILLSVSTNGGAELHRRCGRRRPAHAGDGQRRASRRAATSGGSGRRSTRHGGLAVSYYDRQYGDDETTGVLGLQPLRLERPLGSFGVKRVTSRRCRRRPSSRGQFFGDYTGLDALDDAHPIWADTRDPDLFLCPGTGTPGTPPGVCIGTESAGHQAGLTANDEDIFTAGVPIPAH